MSSFQAISLFLVKNLFTLYITVLLLRLIFQYLRVDYYNPVSQFIVSVTSPLVVPLRRVIPGYWGIDFATVFLIVIGTMLKLILLFLIRVHFFPSIIWLVLWTVMDVFSLTLNIFFYAILGNIVLSWVAPQSHSPITGILYQLSEPLLAPARNFIPRISGFDISPIPVLFGLQVLILFFSFYVPF